jgi:hypothetical protein
MASSDISFASNCWNPMGGVKPNFLHNPNKHLTLLKWHAKLTLGLQVESHKREDLIYLCVVASRCCPCAAAFLPWIPPTGSPPRDSSGVFCEVVNPDPRFDRQSMRDPSIRVSETPLEPFLAGPCRFVTSERISGVYFIDGMGMKE